MATSALIGFFKIGGSRSICAICGRPIQDRLNFEKLPQDQNTAIHSSIELERTTTELDRITDRWLELSEKEG